MAVVAADGRDLTPCSLKAQALIALLATSPDLHRNRRWLEAKLWSDRGPAQAAGSLRQALTEIRHALGPASGALVADRQKVGLDRSWVEIAAGDSEQAEFIEGLDIRAPEFEAWLRDERMRRLARLPLSAVARGAGDDLPFAQEPVWRPPAAVARPGAWTVIFRKSRIAVDALSLIEDLFVDAAALTLHEALGVPVLLRPPSGGLTQAVQVEVQAFIDDNRHRRLRLRAVDLDSARILWTGRSAGLAQGLAGVFEGGSFDLELSVLAGELIEGLADALSLRTTSASLTDPLSLERLAARKMWSMDPRLMVEADALFALCADLSPRGVVLARRAQLRVLQVIERHAVDSALLAEEAQAFCRLALERESGNSVVLALAAYVRCCLDHSPAAGVKLARRSIRINPANPLAWDSLSMASLIAGDLTEGHRLALRVQQMGRFSANRFWWDMGLCVSAAVVGDEAMAAGLADLAVAQAPDFRAALRHKIVLTARAGRVAEAAVACETLQRLEPGFSVDRLARDPEYPVGARRRAGLLRPEDLSGLT